MYIHGAMRSFEYGLAAFGVGFGTEGIFFSVRYLIFLLMKNHSENKKINNEKKTVDNSEFHKKFK